MRAPYCTLPVMALLCLGCQTSFSDIDGSVDSGSDPGPDTAHDSLMDTSDDIPTDTALDTTPLPGQYALHEWGVMVMGPSGATTHGPSPAYAGPIPAKPVIYLYADEPLELDVAVTFASGGPTEVWPVTALEPRVAWEGLQVAPGSCDTTPFPSAWEDPWTEGYCEACTLGQVVVESASCITHGENKARLLFYTGDLPSYEAPLVATAEAVAGPDGASHVLFSVDNASGMAFDDVWLVYRQTTDWCIDPSACPVATADIAWVYLSRVEPFSGEGLTVPIQHFEADLDDYGYPIPGTLGLPDEWEELGSQLEAELTGRGLLPAEAGAFMDAWETIFFGLMGSDAGFIEPFYSSGGSIIYFMPAEQYDEQLPLETSLAPTELIRVGMIYERL